MKKLQPDSEIKLWEKIAEHCDVVAEIIVRVDERRLVSRRDLRRIWACTDEAIKGYVKKGMPKSELSVPSMAVYDLATVNAWREANVDSKRGMAAAKLRREKEEGLPPPTSEDAETDATDDPVTQSYALREIIAKTTSAEEDAITKTLKRKALEGQLVEADDLDKAMAEQAILHKTDKINDEKVLPTLLEMKSASDIASVLYEHNLERLSHFDKIINREFKCPETLYDVVEVVLTRLAKGESPEIIIGRISA